MADHIYVGSGKERTFDNGGSVVTVTVDIAKLLLAFKDYGFSTESGKQYIKLKVGARREVDQYGNTHSVEVDTWKPNGQGSAQTAPRPQAPKSPPAPAMAEDVPPDFPDDIPGF